LTISTFRPTYSHRAARSASAAARPGNGCIPGARSAWSAGVEITDVQQLGAEGSPGSRFAFFSDPDGNG
jgi:ATP-dependent helicase YprA (DUF1998 family)